MAYMTYGCIGHGVSWAVFFHSMDKDNMRAAERSSVCAIFFHRFLQLCLLDDLSNTIIICQTLNSNMIVIFLKPNRDWSDYL